MNRFERASEPDKTSKHPWLLRVARWLSVNCVVGMLLACATAAVAMAGSSNFSGKERGACQSNKTGIRLDVRVLRPFTSPAPVPMIETATSSPIIRIAQVNDAGANAKPQWSGQLSDEMPTLAVDQVINCLPRRSAPFPLSVNADGVVPDQSVIALHGLPKGTTLSAGRSDGAGGWILAPDDLGPGLLITAGGDASGSNELVIQLLTPEGRIASEVRTSLTISGIAKSNENEITSEDVQSLLSHGQHLEGLGYFAGARLFFERAAEAGSAEAARAMGETYDPVEFQKLGVQGLVPDEAMARKWYDRALELEARHPKQTGSVE